MSDKDNDEFPLAPMVVKKVNEKLLIGTFDKILHIFDIKDFFQGNEVINMKNEEIKYLTLIPENQIIIKPEKEIKIDVPKSGWVITKITGIMIIVKEIKIDANEFIWALLILWKNLARQMIIAIFISSEGWRFKKYKSIHLFDPEAFTPYKETHTSKPKTMM